MGPAAVVGIGASLIGGIFGSSSAKKAKRAARREAARLQAKLNYLEENRQEIINPYEDFENLSSTLSNPFASLGVAAQATEIKKEETDLALASTLDTLRATGASAGGATALAQAALRSKRNVAADIERQEAQNEKLRAQGEQQLQQQKMAEERRMQQAGAAGKQFVFQTQEGREMQQLNRVAAQLGQAQQAAGQAQRDQTNAITGMFGNLAQIGIGSI